MMAHTYYFARNVERCYFEVKAESEAEARVLLEQNPWDYKEGSREMDDDESPYELIDVEEEEAA